MPPPPGQYGYAGTIITGIWAQRSAGWQKVANESVFVGDDITYSTGGNRNYSWSVDGQVFQLGSGVLAVGVTIESHNVVSATLDSFTQLAWQAQGSGAGTRSATPNGEKTTVTVQP